MLQEVKEKECYENLVDEEVGETVIQYRGRHLQNMTDRIASCLDSPACNRCCSLSLATCCFLTAVSIGYLFLVGISAPIVYSYAKDHGDLYQYTVAGPFSFGLLLVSGGIGVLAVVAMALICIARTAYEIERC